jgi:iron complex transport system substrate-binding protein
MQKSKCLRLIRARRDGLVAHALRGIVSSSLAALACNTTPPVPGATGACPLAPSESQDGSWRRLRIVSVSLASDTTLVHLIGPERLAAVSWVVDWEEYSPYVGVVPQGSPRLSGNAESVIALHPDLAVVAEYSTPGISAPLRAVGVPTFELTACRSFEEIFHEVQQLGACVGAATRASEWVSSLRSRMAVVDTHAARRAPKRGLIIDGGSAQGVGTLADEMLSRLRVNNLALQTRLTGSVTLDAERLLAWQPEVVFVAVADVPGARNANAELSSLPGYDLVHQSVAWTPPHVIGVARRALGAVSPFAVDALEAMDKALEQIGP